MRARCILQPMDQFGLEGYQQGDTYRCSYHPDGPKGRYYRVYPQEDSNYYETCSAIAFRRFFQLI